MTRAEMIKIILQHPDKEFQSEVQHHTHGIDDREYAYDEVTALFDIEQRAEDHAKKHADARRLLKIARDLLIQIGFYRVMPQDEINNTFVSSGTKWAFKLNGVAYTTDETTDEWMFPEETE